MILVVGATGYLGGMITRQLSAKGREVRVLVRSGSDHQSLSAAGAQPAIGDLHDRPSLERACAGITTLIATAGTRTFDYDAAVMAADVDGYANLIAAAQQAGVSHFIFVSALGADANSAIPYVAAKGQIETRLRASGLRYTILEPSYFMDFWFMAFIYSPVMSGEPVWVLGDGRDPHSPIAAQDVAAFAVAAVDRPGAEDRVIRIGGPQPLSLCDAALMAERMLGRPATLRSFAPDQPPPGWSSLAVQLMTLGSGPSFQPDGAGIAAEYGVRLTPLEEFLKGALGQ